MDMQNVRHIAQNAGHTAQNNGHTMQNVGCTMHNVSCNTLNVYKGPKGGLARSCKRREILFKKSLLLFSTASQLTSPASQNSKDLNKVLLHLEDLAPTPILEKTYVSRNNF